MKADIKIDEYALPFKPCWKGLKVGDRVHVLDGMKPGTIFSLPPKMSPHHRATVNFDQPDEHGHDCCFCTQEEMVRIN